MGSRLLVSRFGLRGVNAVDSPLHVGDDELLRAQNVEVNREGTFPSLTKRRGLAKTTSGLGGPVHSLTSIPLRDPDVLVSVNGLLVLQDSLGGPPYGVRSTDGTSWVDESGLPAQSGNVKGVMPVFHGRLHHLAGFSPSIYAYDGATSVVVATFPSPTTLPDGNVWTLTEIRRITADDTYLYALVDYDRAPGHTATLVWRIDETYAIAGPIGQAFSPTGGYAGALDESVITIEAWQDAVYVLALHYDGFYNTTRVRRTEPTGTTWTLEDAVGGAVGQSYLPVALVGGGSRLVYTAANEATAPQTALMRGRRASGSWETVSTGFPDSYRFYPILVNGLQGSVVRQPRTSFESHVMFTQDWATFTDISGAITPLSLLWTNGLIRGGATYTVAYLGGSGYTVYRVTPTAVEAVLSKPSGFEFYGFGGWQ